MARRVGFWIAWYLPMGFPNVCRSFAYSVQIRTR